MKRLLLIILMFLGLLKSVEAKHLKGGWIQYEYLGPGATVNTSKYRITIRQYATCGDNSVSPQDAQIFLGIFDAGNNALVQNVTIDSVVNGATYLNKESYNPCISSRPQVCYIIKKYQTTVDLPNNNAGYILAVQRCCRINTIVNVFNAGFVGITYYNTIPGGINRNCNSPVFVQKDTVLICYSSPFVFDFSAIDTATAFAPADSISYSFCEGWNGASHDNPGPAIPSAPPYSPIPYNAPYSGIFPMGPDVSIDPVTGIISGTAPSEVGDYAVAVCALQYRGGVYIGTTKKEIHITVADCSLNAAKLRPVYNVCDSFSFQFRNEIGSPALSYTWYFNDSLSLPTLDTSHNQTPTHIFSDTGKYNIKLVVTASGGCVDSAKSIVKVYPGFNAGFKIQGSCIHTPYLFIDTSYSKYGKVNNWSWDVGETSVTTDTFSIQNPTYTYPTIGQKTVTLIVENSNGCKDTATQVLNVKANPVLFHTHDTLICNVDTLQLFASEQNGSGNETFSWTSTDSIINPNSPNPFVYPKDTATYFVKLTDMGCSTSDSVIVYTLPSITVKAIPKDSAICESDSVRLNAITQGLGFTWTSSSGEKVDPVKNPVVKPKQTTAYYILANLGDKCFARDTSIVNVYPYPFASAGLNDSMCFAGSIQLHGNYLGSKFSWSPTNSLSDSTSLNPIATPDSTTNYVLTSYYTGVNVCPKPLTDTVKVIVFPKVILNAGNDTTVVVNQPLQLKATGNVDSVDYNFLWTTFSGGTDYLNKNDVYNPVATYPLGVDSITYVVQATVKNSLGCFAKDTIHILVYQTPPEIFVPTAFTPDADINKIERPIPVGILNLEYFSIYNRFGQLLYTTSVLGQGWDGTFKGVPQPPGTYVFVAKALDYFGRPLTNKGTVVLIR